MEEGIYNCSGYVADTALNLRYYSNYYSLLTEGNLTILNNACNCTTWHLDTVDAVPISAIRIVTSLLSVVGSASIILSALLTGKLNTSEIHPLFMLSVGDFILSILWLIGGIVWLSPGQGGWAQADSSSHSGMCYVLGLATTMAEMVTFMLTVIYGLSALIGILEVYWNKGRALHKNKQKRWKHITQVILYVVSWTLPLFLVIPISEHFVGIESTNKGCWCIVDFYNLRPDDGNNDPHSSFNTFAYIQATILGSSFLVASTLIIVVYAVTFFFVIKVTTLQAELMEEGRGERINKAVMVRLSLFVGIFLLCGIPSFAAAIAVWSENERLHLYERGDEVILYLHAILAPLQGALNAVVYGWTRKEFRNAMNLQRRLGSNVVGGTIRRRFGSRYNSLGNQPDKASSGDERSTMQNGLIMNPEEG